MDPQVQPSFIPKKPLVASAPPAGSAAFGNFFFVIAMLVLIASAVGAGGVYAYQGYLTQSIASKSDQLQKAKQAFDPQTIEDLQRLDSRMSNAESLLQKHVAASAVFALLSAQTLQNVQFTSFDYALEPDGSAQIQMAGIADSFSTVALQSDQFSASKSLKDVVFSGITVSGSKVGFTVKATVEPALINYAKNLSVSPMLGAPTTQSATTTH